MLEFLVSNWQLILTALLAIVSVVIACIRKKPLDSVYSQIFRIVPAVINMVEKAGHGAEKKEQVINIVLEALEKEFPGRSLEYKAFISSVIELYLSTPQKKGE